MLSSHRLNLLSEPFFYGQHLLMISCKCVSQITPHPPHELIYSRTTCSRRDQRMPLRRETFTGGEARGYGAETSVALKGQNCQWINRIVTGWGHKWANMFSLTTAIVYPVGCHKAAAGLFCGWTTFCHQKQICLSFFLTRLTVTNHHHHLPPLPDNFLSRLRASQL